MKFRPLIKPFFVGVTIHMVLYLSIVKYNSEYGHFMCDGSGCWYLLIIDFPMSLLYPEGGNWGVSTYSPFLGSFWWGLVLITVFKLLKFMNRPKSEGRPEETL